MMARPGGREVVRVGLLGRSGAGRVRICCKDVPRRDRRRAEARNINDYPPASWWDSGLCNRFGQPTPPRAPGGAPRVGRRPRRAPPGAETRASHSKVQFQPLFSSAKCISRREGGRSRSSRTAATAPPAPPNAPTRAVMIILTHEPPLLERKAHSLAVGVCSSVAGACGGIIVIPTDRDIGFYIIPLARGVCCLVVRGLFAGRGCIRRRSSPELRAGVSTEAGSWSR